MVKDINTIGIEYTSLWNTVFLCSHTFYCPTELHVYEVGYCLCNSSNKKVVHGNGEGSTHLKVKIGKSERHCSWLPFWRLTGNDDSGPLFSPFFSFLSFLPLLYHNLFSTMKCTNGVLKNPIILSTNLKNCLNKKNCGKTRPDW